MVQRFSFLRLLLLDDIPDIKPTVYRETAGIYMCNPVLWDDTGHCVGINAWNTTRKQAVFLISAMLDAS